MNEKRLHFMEHLDHLRHLLMDEPRGHAAMSGAILQPPTRADCDWGVVYIEVSGLPADVRARHDRRRDRAGRDRHGRGRRAGDHDPAGHPGRAGDRPGRGHATATPTRSRSRTCRATSTGSTRRSRCPASARCRTASRSAATSTPWSTSTPSACRSTARASDDILEAGLAIMARDQRAGAAAAPGDRRASTTATTSSSSRPARTRGYSRHAMAIYPGWFDRSPCGTGTSARMAELWAPRRAARSTPTSSTSRSSAAGSSAGWSRRPRSPAGRRSSRRSPAAPG